MYVLRKHVEALLLAAGLIAGLVVIMIVTAPISAAQDKPKQTLFTNVNIFDGLNDGLAMNRRVLGRPTAPGRTLPLRAWLPPRCISCRALPLFGTPEVQMAACGGQLMQG